MIRVLFLIVFYLVTGFALSTLVACGHSDAERFGENAFTQEEVRGLDLKIAIGHGTVADNPYLLFKISFVMPRNRLALKLPDVFLRKEKLYNRIQQLSVSAGGKFILVREDPSYLILQSPKGERVELSYLVSAYEPGDAQSRKESFSAPIIRKDYFQFVGLMALIFPLALIDAPPFSVELNWQVPEDYKIYNSYGGQQRMQKVVTDFDKLRDSFFVAGQNLRVHEIKIRTQPVYITFEGEWDLISDADFIHVVSRLLSKQRETWKDDNFPYFLVNFLSVASNCNGNIKFAGTAHPNSFRAFFPSGCKFLPDMKQLISHELMHMWIGKKIKVGKERGHIDGKWFTEGFNDYYGRILAYRAGVLSEKEYFTSLNRQMEKYYIARERLTPLKDLIFRMYRNGYSSKSLEEVPYEQGEIMAWHINQRIKIISTFAHSLDDAIRDMLAIANRHGGSKNFTVEEIAAVMDRYAPGELLKEFAKIVQGSLFTPPILEGCSIPYARYYTQNFAVSYKVSSPIIAYSKPEGSCSRWLQ